jgi:hypothetical protein
MKRSRCPRDKGWSSSPPEIAENKISRKGMAEVFKPPDEVVYRFSQQYQAAD